MVRNRLTLLAALLLTTVAHGQVLLNRFGPVTGVLVGTAGEPETTAATISTLQPILSTTPGLVLNGATGGSKGAGTINATGLYVNGSAVGVGGGAVSSVGLTAPTCFSVTGSPVTSSGSLGLTLTGSSLQVVHADGTCSLINLTNGVTGNLDALTNLAYPQTAAESAVSVTPVNVYVPPPSVVGYVLLERYGGAGNNSTANDTPMVNALKVAGQTLSAVGLLAGGIYDFTGPIDMTGTTSGVAIEGVGGVGTISCSASLTSAQNCITAGNGATPRPQVIFKDLVVNCNNPTSGGDCVVIQGANAPIVEDVVINQSHQDAFVISVSGSSFVEKLLVDGLRLENNGRNAIRLQLAGTSGAYINEAVWRQVEVRGVSKVTAGGAVVYMTSTATGAGSKFANHTFIDPNWDSEYAGSPPAPNVSPFNIDSGTAQNFVVIGGGWESTGGVSPGTGYHQTISGSGTTWGGYSVIGVLTNSFWGSNGVNPAVTNLFNSDFSLHATQLMGPVTVAGTASTSSLILNSANSATANESEVQINRSGSTINAIGEGPGIELFDTLNTTASQIQNSGGQTELWQFNSGAWNQIFKVGTTRGLTLNAPASGSALTVDGGTLVNLTGSVPSSCTNYTLCLVGLTTTGLSEGLRIFAGTNSSDFPLVITNSSGANNWLLGYGDGGFVLNGATGGDKGAGSLNAQSLFVNGVAVSTGGGQTTGTFTGTLTGLTSTVNCSMKYYLNGSIVTLVIASGTCSGTSNSSALTMTGIPVAIQPSLAVAPMSFNILDSGNDTLGYAQLGGATTAGTIAFGLGQTGVISTQITTGGIFQTSGSKGLDGNFQITYSLGN